MMMHLENKAFKDSMFIDILEVDSTDVNLVTRDGTYRTHKLLLWSAFPVLQDCLLESFKCEEEVTVILPQTSVDKVQEGIVKMLLEGDLSYLESIFGIKSSVDTLKHNKESNALKGPGKVVSQRMIPSDNCNNLSEEIFEDPLALEVYVKEEICLQEEEDEEFLPPPKKRPKKDVNTICSECGKKFRDKSNLSRHLKRGHKKVTCERCDKDFDGHVALNTHLKTCWFRCEICDWLTKYKTGERMNGHKRRHAKEGEKCTFVIQQIEECEVESLRKLYSDHWKNKERQYTERITYVYKYRKDENDIGPDDPDN